MKKIIGIIILCVSTIIADDLTNDKVRFQKGEFVYCEIDKDTRIYLHGNFLLIEKAIYKAKIIDVGPANPTVAIKIAPSISICLRVNASKISKISE